jgi:amino acid transporter
VIATALSLSSTFEGLAVMANVAALLLYFLCCAGAWELMRRDIRADGQPFSFPGARIFPIVGFVLIIWILTHATAREFIVTGGVLAVGSVLYAIRTAFVKRRTL